jgi:RNA polymerase sigma factor (sigma-70 family)
VRDDPSVVALVTRAAGSDEGAWHELVDRYAPLVWSICVRYRLSGADIEDVGQTVWLGLVEQLSSEKLREPAALPGWLATTTRNECLKIQRAARRNDLDGLPPEDQLPAEDSDAMIEQEIMQAERNAAFRAAWRELTEECHRLLALLMTDPPLGYKKISERLVVPIGSIGPTRGRCLDRLRKSPHLAGLLSAQPGTIAVNRTGR